MKKLDNVYTYHAPKGDQSERYESIRAKARELAELIEECCPDSREKGFTGIIIRQKATKQTGGAERARPDTARAKA